MKAKSQEIEQEMEFTPSYRWQHWIRVFAIVTLIITGFYLAKPFVAPIPSAAPDNFMNALFRSWHQIAGFVLIAVVIFKSYLFLFTKAQEKERAAFKDIFSFKVWKEQIGYYLLVSKRPKLTGVYNPLQFVAYAGFYFMIFGLIITGLILYASVYHSGMGGLLYEPMRNIEAMIGGLAVVRQWHHILMWGVILFIAIHIYLAVFNAIFGKEGAMDAIFSGMKWNKKN